MPEQVKHDNHRERDPTKAVYLRNADLPRTSVFPL